MRSTMVLDAVGIHDNVECISFSCSSLYSFLSCILTDIDIVDLGMN